MAAHFPFRFERRLVPFSLAFGITPRTAWVRVGDEDLEVRFGPWHLVTPRRNLVEGSITGPYSFTKVAGPAHLSFSDRGVTFATTTERGVCFTLAEPVPALDPFGRLRHPGVTMTVADPERLLEVAPLPD